jgi:flagellar biogenesis protein FliO
MIDETLLKAFLTLMACAALLGGILWYIKRWAARKSPLAKEVNIRITGRMSLPPKAIVYTMQVAGRTLLIGVTDHSVALLADLTESTDSIPATIESAKQNSIPSLVDDSPEAVSFGAFLKAITKRENS